MKSYGIILASGRGERFGGNLPKQFTQINGRTILELAVDAFENNPNIDGIILVITPEYIEKAEKIVAENNYKKVLKILKGGETRKDSSKIGVNSVDETEAIVLIHDCARPFVSQKIIDDCITALKKYDAVCTAIPATDTILEVQEDTITQIPPRSQMWQAQTPQGFKLSLIKKAHELTENDKEFTDDCGLVRKFNIAQIHVVTGAKENFKITFSNDINVTN